MRHEKIAPDSERDATERARRNEEQDRKKSGSNEYRIVELRAEEAVLELDDSRVFVARLGDGVDREGLRKGMIATITSDGMDKSDAPKDAVVTKVAPKDA
jgi:hypothetical protein